MTSESPTLLLPSSTLYRAVGSKAIESEVNADIFPALMWSTNVDVERVVSTNPINIALQPLIK